MAKPKHAFASYRTATFISLLVGYMGYYLCRQNFSVAYGPMKEAVGLDALTYGEITSVGTLIYALGKFTTGALADSRGGKLVFFIGLVCSAIASIVFGLGSGVAFFFVLWGLNRFFQSMGWGGLVNVMAQWFPPKHHGTAMGIMSVSYQFGGVLALSFAGLLLSLGAGWRGVFLYPGITLLVLGLILYPFLKGSPREVGYELPEDDGKKHRHVPSDEHLDYWSRFRRVFSDRLFIVMCGLSFILTFLREIFGTWMPAYFTDLGAQASVAAFKSTLFPLLGCLGTLFAGWFSDRYLQARRGPVMAVSLAGLAVVLAALAALEHVSTLLGIERNFLALILTGLAGFLLLGSYSLVGGVVALDFGGRKTAGTAAGLLDGVGYLAATLSGFGVAKIVVHGNWSGAYTMMGVVSVAGALLCLPVWKTRPKED